MPITEASLETDLRLAVALDTALRIILTDMASIRNTGAILNLGSVSGTGSDTSRIRFAGLDGTDSFATTADGAAVAETALTDASADIAVVRGAIMREITDLATLTGFADDINPARLAQSMAGEYERYFNGLAAAAVANFGTDVGNTAVAMSVDDYYDAIFALEVANVPGGYFCLLAPVQLANLQESLRAEGGAVQWMPATAEMLSIRGQGYAGTFLGVDVFRSSDVTTTLGARDGGMWGPGALAYKTGTMRPPIGAVVTSPNSEIVVEFNRNAAAGITEIVGHAYVGVGLIEDDRGIGITTLA